MLKRILAVLLFTSSIVFAQSGDPFTTADRIDITGYGMWRKYTNQRDDSSSIQVLANQIQGYDPLGAGYWGAAFFDSTLSGLDTLSIRFTIASRGVTYAENAHILLTNAADSSATTTTGFTFRMDMGVGIWERMDMRRLTGTGGIFTRSSNLMTAIGGNDIYAVGDTVELKHFPAGVLMIRVISAAGATKDSQSIVTTTPNHANWKAGIMMKVGTSEPSVAFDNFSINTSGGVSPPPTETDLLAPVLSSPRINGTTLLVDGVVTASVDVTDDSAGIMSIMQDTSNDGVTFAQQGIQYYPEGTLSATYTGPSFTRDLVDTIWVRFRAADNLSKLDTSTTVVGYFVTAPTDTNTPFNMAAYVYLPSWQINMGSGDGNYGIMPVGEIDWGTGTHFSIFAGGFSATSVTMSYNNLVPGRRGPLSDLAHAAGKPLYLAIGGAGAITGMRNAFSAANRHDAVNLILQEIRANRWDGLDIDWEPYSSTDDALIIPFIHELYDSFQTMNAYWNTAKRPQIVFTMSPGGSTDWDTRLASIVDEVEFFNLMSYDKMGTWTVASYFDCSVTALDANGNVAAGRGVGSGRNLNPATLQRQGEQMGAIPRNKILLGFDVMGARMQNNSGPWVTMSGVSISADLKFFNPMYGIIAAAHPDSIHYESNEGVYWMRDVGAGTWYSFGGAPGYDSAMGRAVEFIAAEGYAGIMIWDVTEAYVASLPTHDERNWVQAQMRKYLSTVVETLKVVPPAPNLTAPTAGATSQSIAAVLDWDSVSGYGAITKQWVQYATTSISGGGASITNDSTLVVSTKTLSSLANNTTYYWRVALKNADGWGNFSPEFSFTTIVAAPGAPTITYPTASLLLPGTDVTVLFTVPTNPPATWVSGTSFYQCQVGTVAAMTSGIVAQDSGQTLLTTRSFTVNGLTSLGTYYTRARVKTLAGYGAWSTIVQFGAGSNPSTPPILQIPVQGASGQVVNPLLVWTKGQNAITTQIMTDTLASFATGTVVYNSGTNFYSGFTGDSGRTYYWRGRSLGFDTSNWSSAFYFTIVSPTDSVVPPPPPPPPRSTVQMGYWFDIVEGKWVYDRPTSWLLYNYSASDMSDIPTPSDSTIAWSPYGIKSASGTSLYSFGTSTGGGGAMAAAAILDSLQTITLGDLKLSNPTIRSGMTILGQDTMTSVNIGPPLLNQEAVVFLDLPDESGKVARTGGDDLFPHVILPEVPLAPQGGGLGIAPMPDPNATSPTYPKSLWGYDPDGDMLNWTLLPIADLQGDFPGTGGGSGTDLSDATADSAKASIHVKDEKSIYLYDAAGAIQGRLSATNAGGYLQSGTGSTNPVMITSGHDGSGVVVMGYSGTEILQRTKGEKVLRLRGERGATDAFQDFWVRSDTTTVATPRVVFNLSLDSTLGSSVYGTDNVTYLVRFDVVASRTDSNGYAKYSREILYRNNAGTVTEISEDVIGADVESAAATDCGFAVSGDYVQVTWTGILDDSWRVDVWAKLILVSN